jgi:hypothetical protein
MSAFEEAKRLIACPLSKKEKKQKRYSACALRKKSKVSYDAAFRQTNGACQLSVGQVSIRQHTSAYVSIRTFGYACAASFTGTRVQILTLLVNTKLASTLGMLAPQKKKKLASTLGMLAPHTWHLLSLLSFSTIHVLQCHALMPSPASICTFVPLKSVLVLLYQ